MRITQKEIARQMGVSTMTISRVLNGKGGNKVSAELVCKIRNAAAKAGYHRLDSHEGNAGISSASTSAVIIGVI